MSIESKCKNEVTETFNQNDIQNGMMIDVGSGGGQSESLVQNGSDLLTWETLKSTINEIFGEQEFLTVTAENDVEKRWFSYVHIIAKRGGVDRNIEKEKEDIEKELRKSKICGEYGLKYWAPSSDNEYYKFLHCMRFWCRECGRKDGRIHKRRKARVIAIMEKREGGLDAIALGQYVFTVPEEWREFFLEKKTLNYYLDAVRRVIRKHYPSYEFLLTLHLFNKDGVFHPHANVLLIRDKNEDLFISKEELEKVRESYTRGLRGLGLFGQEHKLDINYRIKRTKRKIYHAIKYMCRPCPSYEELGQILQNHELSYLTIVDLKGFNFIRHCGKKTDKLVQDTNETTKELSTIAGEYIKLVEVGIMRKHFNMKYQEWDYDEIADGFYRIKKKGVGKGVKK